MERIFIKPAEGRLVRDPLNKTYLPADGADVAVSTYWLRRLKSGEVLEVKPPVKIAPSPVKK